MKKYIILILSLLLITTNSLAYTPPPTPTNGHYVVDMSGKLSNEEINQLNLKIEKINKETTNQFGILLLSDMGGANIEDVAYDTFNTWHIGQKDLDNGVLIVVALKERKSRIEVGKGIGGELTDIQSNDILKNHLNPHLKKGDFYGGFDETITSVNEQLTKKSVPAEPLPAKSYFGAIMLGLIILVTIIVIFLNSLRSRKKYVEPNWYPESPPAPKARTASTSPKAQKKKMLKTINIGAVDRTLLNPYPRKFQAPAAPAAPKKPKAPPTPIASIPPIAPLPSIDFSGSSASYSSDDSSSSSSSSSDSSFDFGGGFGGGGDFGGGSSGGGGSSSDW